MKKSLSTTILHFQDKPHLLPPNISTSTIQSLIPFCLDNSYFEFNGQFYSQDTGGTMGSPLVVELAEIRVADVENTALTTYKDPPNTYRHFVDDGIGDFHDKSHAYRFLKYLNSLTDDLQYTIEYPSHDGSLQKTYTHQPQCPLQFLCPLFLQRQCHQIPYKTSSHPMLPQHLQKELDTVYTTSLQNGHPPDRVKRIMDSVKQKLENPNKLTLKQFNRQLKGHHSILDSILPLPPYHHQKDQKIPSIPRRQSHKFIRDYPSGPTHQNEDHTSSSPHSQRHL